MGTKFTDFLVCDNGKEEEMKESCGDPSYRRERENVKRDRESH